MELFLDYITYNFATLILLMTLTATLIVNRQLSVPATRYFVFAILTLLLITVVDSMNQWLREGLILSTDRETQLRITIDMTVLEYILRPLVMLILSLIVIPSNSRRILFAIPAVLNAVVYIHASHGIAAYYIIEKYTPWHASLAGMTVYYVEVFNLLLLILSSIFYFNWEKTKRSAIIFLIAVQYLLVSLLEGFGLVSGYANPISALGILEYYFYLSVIYQYEMHDAVTQKELTITQHKLSLLRSQMHPHFIINALSIIRSLVKRDTERAEREIDAFSDYLNVHIHAIQTDGLIDFDQELSHVNAYLSLVQADRSRQIQVLYDLKVTDFQLPSLSLEPLIENAVKYGTGIDNGVITISTEETPNAVLIRVADNGTGDPEQKQKPESTGIGIANTKQRLKMQCGGTLNANRSDDGMIVTISIPKPKEVIQ